MVRRSSWCEQILSKHLPLFTFPCSLAAVCTVTRIVKLRLYQELEVSEKLLAKFQHYPQHQRLSLASRYTQDYSTFANVSSLPPC